MDFLLESISLFGLGLVLGLQHALNPDHVVAVSTLVSQTNSLRQSSLLGVIWGTGHTITLFILGSLVLIIKLSIPEKLALSFEFGAGVFLVFLGVNLLWRVLRGNLRQHDHDHTHETGQSGIHFRSSLLLGVIHGFAGGGILLLPILATVDSIAQGLFFILLFGAGSILGMAIATTLIALPFKVASHSDRITQAVRVLAGTTGILVGFSIMYSVSFTEHLLF